MSRNIALKRGFVRPARVWASTALGFVLAHASFAETWRASLYPEDWSPPGAEAAFASQKLVQDFSYAGYHAANDPVPEKRGESLNVIDRGADPTGHADSTAAIQQTIDEAARRPGSVVFIPEGTYHVSVPEGRDAALEIYSDDLVFRGAGAQRTRILNTTREMKRRSIIDVRPRQSGGFFKRREPSVALTQDVLGAENLLHVQDAKAFPVGSWVVVRADLTDEWVAEHQVDWPQKNRPSSSFAYVRRITGSDPTAGTVTIDVPLRYFLKMRDHARIEPAPGLLHDVGLEDFSVGNLESQKTHFDEEEFTVAGTGAFDADSSYAVSMNQVRDSWIQRVESFHPTENRTLTHLLSNGIRLTSCARATISRCRFSYPQYGGGNGNGYMYRLQDTQETLIQDCVADHCRHGFVLGGVAASGNVYLRCTDRFDGYAVGDGQTKPDVRGYGSDHHMWFSHSNLIDSCVAERSTFAAFYRPWSNHFLTSAHTVFWNVTASGSREHFGVISQQGRYGYVFGTRGDSANVQTASPTGKGTATTDPLDVVEGIGRGETLRPQSLYEDQLARRRAKMSVTAPTVR